MGFAGPAHQISLLLAVAIIAATCGFIASTVLRRNKHRARRLIVLGFFCGITVGMILRGYRRSSNAYKTVSPCADAGLLKAGMRLGADRFADRARTFAASHVRLASSPPQCHRLHTDNGAWWRQTRRIQPRMGSTGR